MKKLLSTQRVALAFAAVMLASVPAMAAEVSVGVALPGIAFGYSDGYWDRDHHWHEWRDRDEAEHWRAENREHFYAYNHDHDHDQGWHETDHYWEHR